MFRRVVAARRGRAAEALPQVHGEVALGDEVDHGEVVRRVVRDEGELAPHRRRERDVAQPEQRVPT